MPSFDFKCKDCNLVEEHYLSGKEVDEPQQCPKCGKEMTKLIASSIRICQHGYSYNTSERDSRKKWS